jgi:hypothetical protein
MRTVTFIAQDIITYVSGAGSRRRYVEPARPAKVVAARATQRSNTSSASNARSPSVLRHHQRRAARHQRAGHQAELLDRQTSKRVDNRLDLASIIARFWRKILSQV